MDTLSPINLDSFIAHYHNHFSEFTDELQKVLEILKSKPGNLKKELENIIDNINTSFSSPGNFNFYPSDSSTDCKEYCLGIATKKFGHDRLKDKNRTGFKGLIKELVQYWLECGRVNQTTVILVTDWDSGEFQKEWLDIINTRVRTGKSVRIYEILNDKTSYLQRYPVV
jgi:hypothetical protein